MKKLLSVIVASGVLSATTIPSGLNIVGSSISKVITSGDYSNVNVIYGAVNGNYKAYKPSNPYSTLKDLISNSGYIIENSSSFDSSDFELVNSSINKECEISLISGLNIVSLPDIDIGSMPSTINGANINVIYGVVDGNYKAYKPTNPYSTLKESNFVNGGYYIVETTSASTGTCNDEINTTIEEPPSTPDLNGTTTDTNGTDNSIGLPPQVPSV